MGSAAEMLEPGPAWDVARLYPDQGQWSEDEYLRLTDGVRRLVELSDGRVEILSMPKTSHQRIVAFLFQVFARFVDERAVGTLLFAPIRVRLWDGKFREPDLVFMLAANAERVLEPYWLGADLVVEVVSDDDRDRDLVVKRREYAEAGIQEYWIVDPKRDRVTVLDLDGGAYATFDEATGVGRVRSKLLDGLEVDVASLLASGAR